MLYTVQLKYKFSIKKKYRAVISACAMFFVFFIATSPCLCQELDNRNILNLGYLNYNNELPKDLLSERTVVLVDDELPSNEKLVKFPAWKAFATKAHETFARLGIDPVAYYNMDLLLAGQAVTSSFADDIKKRAIPIALILNRTLSNSQDTIYSITLGRISKEAVFFEAGQQAFRIQNNSFNGLMQQFIRAVSSSGLERGNFLILDTPEFFNQTQIFTARRFEKYNPDMKLDKLAVPLFEGRTSPKSIPAGMNRNEVAAKVALENREIAEANERLKNIMQQYPFNSGPVNYSDGEAAWRKEGYLFVLLNVHGRAETVRDLLNYESADTEAIYTSIKIVAGDSTIKTIPKNQEVYKFYVKHIPSGEVYLGNYWDADTTWTQALENFIANLKAALKVE